MRIVQLQAESFKRLQAVDITPQGDLVVLSGRNAQGKSSVLDAIWAAVGGGRAQPDDPIHHGADQARIYVDLGEITVERTYRGDGKTTLVVKAANGAKISSPQAVLDKLVGKLSFDPLKFANSDDKAQLATLLQVVQLPIDLDELAVQRQAAYDNRTEAGRELRSVQARVAAIPAVPGTTPNDELDVVALAQRSEELSGHLARLEQLRQRHAQVTEQIRALQEEQGELAGEGSAIMGYLASRFNTDNLAGPAVLEQIRSDMMRASEINEHVRNRKAKIQGQADIRIAQRKVDDLTSAIEKIDARKSAAISAARMPIEGLSFTDDGVTYNGVPFSQASSAERIRVSTAVAMALNPNLRVIHIEDGSLLDNASAQAIAQLARDNDCQVWVEKVDETGQIGIVIEDGMVAQ